MRNFRKKAFTMAEAIIVIAFLGVIAAITIPQLKTENVSQKSLTTMGQKMVGYLTQAVTEILIFDAGMDDLTRLKDETGIFSIEDADIAPRISKLFQKYLTKVDSNVDLTNPYFTSAIKDYKKVATAVILKDNYKGFFTANDGVLIGFKAYGDCTATEDLTNPPNFTEKYTVNNICASVFFDVNGYKKPNKLGSDQYIIPIDKRGLIYENP